MAIKDSALRKVIWRGTRCQLLLVREPRVLAAASPYRRLVVVVEVVAISAQSILLVVSRITWNSLVGMDRLDLGARRVFLCYRRRVFLRYRRRRLSLGRVGRVIGRCRVSCRHGGSRKGEHSKTNSRSLAENKT